MDGANRLRVRHGACAVPSIGLCDWGHVQGMSPAVWRDERREPGAAQSPEARRQNDLKGLRQKGSSTLMPCGLVWGMNDHQGSCWVLIVVTHTHRPLAATWRQSLRHIPGWKAVVQNYAPVWCFRGLTAHRERPTPRSGVPFPGDDLECRRQKPAQAACPHVPAHLV